jgi:hypothetical protein
MGKVPCCPCICMHTPEIRNGSTLKLKSKKRPHTLRARTLYGRTLRVEWSMKSMLACTVMVHSSSGTKSTCREESRYISFIYSRIQLVHNLIIHASSPFSFGIWASKHILPSIHELQSSCLLYEFHRSWDCPAGTHVSPSNFSLQLFSCIFAV